MAVDELVSRGINVKRFSDETVQKFEELKKAGKIPSFAANLNPLDLTGSVTSEMFELGTRILFDDPEVYGILFLGLHHSPELQEDYVDRIVNLSKNYHKPIAACDIGETEMARFIRSRFDKLGIPAYSSPEDAARAIVALVNYGLYLKKNGDFEEYLSNWAKFKRGTS